MLEAKYYKDYRHNYMILQCRQEEASRSYQYKILTSGKIREILRCSIRYVNGQTYFYYDISSKTTLENFYQGKKMSYEQVKDLLQQIHNIYSRIGSFFIEEAKLVILPEAIYYDLTDQKYIGLYYPDYKPEMENPYEAFMEYLLDHIDTENQQLADCMYQIYEMSEEACFSIEDALQLLERCKGKEETITVEPVLPHIEQNSDMTKSEDLFEIYEPESIPVKKKSLFYPVFAGISVCGITAAMIIYFLYELSSEETLILIGCVAAMGVCLLICLAMCKKDHRKEDKGGMRRTDPIPDKESDDLYGAANHSISLENVLSNDMDLCMAEQRPKAEKFLPEDVKYGNTVFFDISQTAEYKLYALDKKNKNHIELNRFPYTIGKMAGCVDYVLSDDSVSRIHAKFDKKDDKILLTDLNSTNGTFKNGLRMQPQETIEIEPGDEIRFGNLNYCYR